MSNLDNFKDIADDMLKDIKVSEDLKRKTLQRCKKESSSRRKFIIPSAAVGVAAALTIVMLNFHLLPFNNEKGGDSTQIMMESAGEDSNSSGVNIAEGNENSTSPNSALSSDNGIFQATEDPGTTGPAQSTEAHEGTGKPIYEQGTVEDAKRYMGEEFIMPEYIPSNFKLSLVQVPTDMNKEGMDILFSYEGDKQFYTLTMRKGATSIDNFVGTKETDINGIKAQVTSGPLMADNEEVAPSYTQIRWLKNNVLYMIDGQITEEEAVKVARSIK